MPLTRRVYYYQGIRVTPSDIKGLIMGGGRPPKSGLPRVGSKAFRMYIGNRDGWICGLCGLPIDPSLPYTSEGFGVIDHILPKTKGGGHQETNLQIAHFECNANKGAIYPYSSETSWHGTNGGYTNHHCRCELCTRAHREYCAKERNRYINHHCDCEHCTRTNSVDREIILSSGRHIRLVG